LRSFHSFPTRRSSDLNRVSSKVNIPTRNMLCVPVVSGGKTLGVIQVINKKGQGAFTKHDLRLLELIASPTAIALENMLLYEALIDRKSTRLNSSHVKI